MYTKFKLHFYQEIFQRFQSREASLTTVERPFCMEAIQALGSPTVNEFATFMRISPPNAAYKVNSLVKKGYLRKVQVQLGQAGISSGGHPEICGLLQHLRQLYGGGDGPDCRPLLQGGLCQAGGNAHHREPGLMPEVDIHEASMPE